MKIGGNTILITGGATGIGFALAAAFLKERNEVIVCGRRQGVLQEAKLKLPEVHVKQCDVAQDGDRRALYQWITSEFEDINILVNNAGIQREINFTESSATQKLAAEDEVSINLTAQIRLSALFIPQLMKKKEAAIVNISSGLGFIPLAIVPVYCATKAGIHSFTISLRHQLRNTPVKVFEVIPPTTDTELDKGARARRGQADMGIPAFQVAEATIKGMKDDQYEIAVGRAEMLRQASRTNPEEVFHRMNG